MRRTSTLAVAVAVTAAMAVTGCAKKDPTPSAQGSSSGSTSKCVPKKAGLVVGMAYDVGGRGDKSFNDSAAAGMDKASCTFGFTEKESEAVSGESEAAREQRLKTFAQAGIKDVIAVGFVYDTAVAKIAKQYPQTHFAIIDSTDIMGPNIANLVFSEEQGSYLVGAAAALKSKTGDIGFIGGVQQALIQKFQAGYDAGAKAINPKIKIQVEYLSQPPDYSGFGDPAKGKTTADGMYDNGADIVYAAAGGSGQGVFQAAYADHKKAIGVDSDQYLTAGKYKSVVMTSMVKSVNVAVYDWLTSVSKGTYPHGVRRYDLKSGGISFATSGGQINDIKSKLNALKAKIISGQITVPTKP